VAPVAASPLNAMSVPAIRGTTTHEPTKSRCPSAANHSGDAPASGKHCGEFLDRGPSLPRAAIPRKARPPWRAAPLPSRSIAHHTTSQWDKLRGALPSLPSSSLRFLIISVLPGLPTGLVYAPIAIPRPPSSFAGFIGMVFLSRRIATTIRIFPLLNRISNRILSKLDSLELFRVNG